MNLRIFVLTLGLTIGALLLPATAQQPAPSGAAAPVNYTCSMHPEVITDKPGKCPKCGMALVPVKPGASPSPVK